MKYPKSLQKGDTIGVCAPSGGAAGDILSKRLDKAISNVEALGYRVIETASVRRDEKCVSASNATRAAEFASLYENPDVAAYYTAERLERLNLPMVTTLLYRRWRNE